MCQYKETMLLSTAQILEELEDIGVDERLINNAIEGGVELIRALYLYVMEEAAHA